MYRVEKEHTTPSDSQQSMDLAKAPLSDVETALGTSSEGLTREEVATRQERYGYNELAEEETNPFARFLSFFWGPIPWMIEIAAILSAVVSHWADFGIILALLLVNAVVGFWEEYQADHTVAALRAKLALKARVKREGRWAPIPARELVPGDRIRIRLGDIIPADARLLDGDPVQIDQSGLTGESLPVTRQVGDAVYSGTVLKQGEVDALVYATGSSTYFGKTVHLVESAHAESHFQRAILKIGDYLIVLALILVAVILLVGLFRGDDLLTTMQFALVLTVAAIPVALPTVLSVTMAIGARFLAAKQAIVTRLTSIEELAGMDVLCSDKTGTLTQNKLALDTPVLLDHTNTDQVILDAAIASREEDGDPIDLAVLDSISDKQKLNSYRITHFQPFDPIHKRTEATAIGPDGHRINVTKGAPQVILALVDNANAIRDKVDKVVNDFASHGFRALGVAATDDADHWQFLGVLPIYDPPREDSKATIVTAQEMGIDVKMITGDQIAIAREIAQQLNLGDHILLADTLSNNQPDGAADPIDTADGFAQVFPEDKFHIVDELQQRGHIVGMTGDGVNDAPALKKANVGIAVSGATDAARSAADIVLLTPGLSVIIDALAEARHIFRRMNSYAIYRIAETLRVLLFMTLSILIFNFYPVTAVMIVLLALLNDGAILAIAYDNVEESNQPEKWNMHNVLGVASILGVAGVIASFGLFYLAERVFNLDAALIQSLIYLKLSVAGHLTILITRTRGPFWSNRPSPILLGAVFITQGIATLITVYGVFMAPIGWGWAAVVWLYALAWALVNDRVKLAAYRILDHQQPSLLARIQLARKPSL